MALKYFLFIIFIFTNSALQSKFIDAPIPTLFFLDKEAKQFQITLVKTQEDLLNNKLTIYVDYKDSKILNIGMSYNLLNAKMHNYSTINISTDNLTEGLEQVYKMMISQTRFKQYINYFDFRFEDKDMKTFEKESKKPQYSNILLAISGNIDEKETLKQISNIFPYSVPLKKQEKKTFFKDSFAKSTLYKNYVLNKSIETYILSNILIILIFDELINDKLIKKYDAIYLEANYNSFEFQIMGITTSMNTPNHVIQHIKKIILNENIIKNFEKSKNKFLKGINTDGTSRFQIMSYIKNKNIYSFEEIEKRLETLNEHDLITFINKNFKQS